MNPRTDLEDADPQTARAFVQLFVQHGDLFQFGIDSRTSDDEELRAYLNDEDFDYDGNSTIGVTAVNLLDDFDELRDGAEEMGLNIIEEDGGTKDSKDIGEYEYRTMKLRPDSDEEYDWDVPHLVIYGSLSPELEEACYAAFGHQYEYDNIRNHSLVWGDGLTRDDATTLHDTVGQSSQFFDEQRRDVQSWISTADFV